MPTVSYLLPGGTELSGCGGRECQVEDTLSPNVSRADSEGKVIQWLGTQNQKSRTTDRLFCLLNATLMRAPQFSEAVLVGCPIYAINALVNGHS